MCIVDFVEAPALSVGLQALPCQWPVAAGVRMVWVPNLIVCTWMNCVAGQRRVV
jgi:hypothetical protein